MSDDSNVMTTEMVDKIIQKEKYALKIKRNEILWHNRLFGVRRGGIPFAMTKHERTEYVKCKLSVFYFAQNYCHIKGEDGKISQLKLRDYQENIIKLFDDNRYSILMASRQTGKTVTASIYILWYSIFHDNKGIMIVANKSKTTKEIINKIKSIYKLLPFFLKTGVINWNETSISYENGSRIQTEARTSEPAIGFTIDLLYLDEFAKVPDSIIRTYYGEVVPIVSSIDNSKIIITSTPDGFNLFWEILTGAEKPDDDDEYNGFKSLRVYWYEKKGRRDTKIILSKGKMKKYNGLNKTSIMKYLRKNGYKIYDGVESKQDIIYIRTFKDDDEKQFANKSLISDIRKIKVPLKNNKSIPLLEISRITNWEEEQIKLIGGQSMFRQEYGLEFITDDKTLFDTIKFQQFTSNIKEYKEIEIPEFSKKLPFPYNSLKFVQDDLSVFDYNKRKEYFSFIGIDLSEGLSQDYTVINLFRIMPKSVDWLRDNKETLFSIYDCFKIEQYGMWRSNIYKVNEIAHLLYVLVFDFLDPERTKIAVEMNKNLGNLLMNAMTHVFNGDNEYGEDIFLKYKHNQKDKFTKPGLLIGKDKKYMIKEFQDNILKDNMILSNKDNIIELKTFTKHETPSGDFTYKSQSGHDDMVMSLVNLSSIFDHQMYKEMIDMYIDSVELSNEHKSIIFSDSNINNSHNDPINIIGNVYGNVYKNSDNLSRLFGQRGSKQLNVRNIKNWYK